MRQNNEQFLAIDLDASGTNVAALTPTRWFVLDASTGKVLGNGPTCHRRAVGGSITLHRPTNGSVALLSVMTSYESDGQLPDLMTVPIEYSLLDWQQVGNKIGTVKPLRRPKLPDERDRQREQVAFRLDPGGAALDGRRRSLVADQFRPSFAVDPAGYWLAIGTADGQIWLHNRLVFGAARAASFTGVAISLGNSAAAVAVVAGGVGPDLLAEKAVAQDWMLAHTNEITALAFHPYEPRLVSASRDGTVKIWDTRERDEVLTLKQSDGHAVVKLSFSPDGRTLTGHSDRAYWVWNALGYDWAAALNPK